MADSGFNFGVSSTDSGGVTRTGDIGSVSSPATGDPLDAWTKQQQDIANQMNAGMPGGRGGGGGGGGSLPGTGSGGWVQKNFDGQYDNPGLDLQKQQQAFQESKWNQAFGLLSGQIAKFGSGNPYQIGGSNGTPPEISVGPTYNPQLIDQQVAAMRAKNDQSAASKSKELSDQAIGRGLGTNSPLIAALQGNLAAGNIAANSAGETNLRQTAAQQNSDHVLKTQTERENQWEAANQLAIARAKPFFDQQNALIAALAGLA